MNFTEALFHILEQLFLCTCIDTGNESPQVHQGLISLFCLKK